MQFRTYEIEITSKAPLLCHADNLTHAANMEKWSKDPANKGVSKPGDDRTPAWRWLGCLYNYAGVICLPSDNLMTVLREGGKRCPTGRKGATFKAQSQSGIIIEASAWPLLVGPNKRVIKMTELDHLKNESDYAKHEEEAVKLGFELFAKRARVGQAKHVRVRPKFDVWSCTGRVMVTDEEITTEVLDNILRFAGRYAGLCDWRPSSPKSPGPFGTFEATVKQVSAE